MDPYFLERVEVMRGPTSVLYGNSNPGGVVSMAWSVNVRLPNRCAKSSSMGTDNLWQTGFDFSDAIDDAGVWSYRRPARPQPDAQQDMAKSSRYAVAPSFSWRPDDKTNFTFLSNFQSDPDAGYYGWLPREGTVVPTLMPTVTRTSCRPISTKVKKITRCSVASRWWATTSLTNLTTPLPCVRTCATTSENAVPFGIWLRLYCTGPEVNRQYVRSDEDLNGFTVDTQLQSKFATGEVDHTLLTGVDYSRMRNDVDALYGSADALDMNNPQYGNPNIDVSGPYAKYQVLNRMEQTGLYAQDQMEWDKWY